MREPIVICEIDVDGCSRTFGVGGCTAALGADGDRKCWNTWATCRKRSVFAHQKARWTLRFCEPRERLPKTATFFPVVQGVSEHSATVNIAGADPDLSAFGKRATVKVDFLDFPYHDRLTDPYWAERVSGAAQIDEPGYDPFGRGSFFGKLKARWPTYATRPMRIINAWLEDDGTITGAVTRSYVITGMSGPDSDGRVSFEAADVLDLAKNDRAVAPKVNNGKIGDDMAATGAASFSLTPAGIGDAEYAASGRALIGSEIVAFTRIGDAITIASGDRGLAGSVAATHSTGDSFQQVLHISNARMDDTITTLLVDYAGIDPAFIPTAKWEAEVDRWMLDLKLETHVVKPTGIATLVGELAALGVSVWWDSAAQEIGLKANRPVDGDVVWDLTDDANILEIQQEDQDEKRLTQIHFATVQADPTKTGKANYNRLFVTPDLDAEAAWAYNGQRIREILCRWLDQGADDLVRVISQRLLGRFRVAPRRYTIRLDGKDGGIGLTDVVRLRSFVADGETGAPVNRLVQVIERADNGREIRIVAQTYDFVLRTSNISPNTMTDYGTASDEDKARYAFIGADTPPAFPDGSDYYRIV